MRQVILALLIGIPALASQAAPTVAGRWEGGAEIPGREMPIVVDLAPDASGAWTGSIVIPGFDVKGAALAHIVVTDSAVRFDIGDALGAPPDGAAFEARLNGDGRMVGKMRQAGNVAKFALARTGPPQVEVPPRSTPVALELEGQWSGDYQLGGYPRHVTIELQNHAGGGATADFVVVGKQTTNVPVDLVTQEGDLLSIESHAYGIKFEGRTLKNGEIDGTFEQGTLDLPLLLRRSAGRNS